LFGAFIVDSNYGAMMMILLGVVALVIGITAKTEYLIYLTFYTLVAGSSFDYAVRQQVFYMRFGVLLLFWLRLMPYWRKVTEQRQRTPQARYLHLSPTHGFMFIYVLLAFSSSLYSIDPALSFQRAVALLILLGGVFLYLVESADSHEQIAKYITAMLHAATVLVAAGFMLHFVGFSSMMHASGRLRLLFFGPNELGYVCAILFPASFWYFNSARERGAKILGIISLVTLGCALVLTASRGALLSCALATMLQVVLVYRKQMLIFVGVALFIVANVYIFVPPQTDKLAGQLSDSVLRTDTLSSGSGRLPIWQHALELSRQRRWLGYGFGTVGTLFDQGYFAGVLGDFQGGDLHNSYLEILLDLGVAGLGLFLAALAWAGLSGFRTLVSQRDAASFSVLVMVCACILCGLSSAMFESWMIAPGSVFSFPFWVCIGFLLRAAHFNPEADSIATSK
jgi:O-antigen ligase